MTASLPDDVRALLEAIRDALDIPQAATGHRDANRYLWEDRARAVRSAVRVTLDHGEPHQLFTDALREDTAALPVTYPVHQPPADETRCPDCGCYPDAPQYVTRSCPCTCHDGGER